MLATQRIDLLFVIPLAFALSLTPKTLFSANGLPSESSESPLPSLSAIHISRHEPSDQVIMKVAIDLSPSGLRARELGKNASHEILQDFNGERAWLVDHGRSVSHLLPLVESTDVGDAMPGVSASFLGQKPCGGLNANDEQPGKWRGRLVTAFNCVDDHGEIWSTELVDHIYAIVVYSESVDGFVDELKELTERAFGESHFEPPAEYRAVDKHEFFFGAPALLPYTD